MRYQNAEDDPVFATWARLSVPQDFSALETRCISSANGVTAVERRIRHSTGPSNFLTVSAALATAHIRRNLYFQDTQTLLGAFLDDASPRAAFDFAVMRFFGTTADP